MLYRLSYRIIKAEIKKAFKITGMSDSAEAVTIRFSMLLSMEETLAFFPATVCALIEGAGLQTLNDFLRRYLADNGGRLAITG